MKLEKIDQSIVIVAERHNPSILHPSFLENQNIVGKGKELSEPPICMPDIAIVAYACGLRFSLENTRLQVTEHKVLEENFSLSEVTARYINELPHVGYKSVGCNVFVFIEMEEAEHFLINKFIKESYCNGSAGLSLVATGIRFVILDGNNHINISFDAGNISNDGTNRTGILIRGNYHIDTLNVLETVEGVNCFSNKIEVIMQYLKNTFNDKVD